jgi:hypothetical protein
VGSDFTAHGRRDIADRDPSDGSDEEAEKRGSVHGGSILYKVYLAVQQDVQIDIFN